MTTAIKVEVQLANGDFITGMMRAGQSLAQFNQQLLRANPSLATFANANGSVIQSLSRANAGTQTFLGTLRDLSIVTGVVSMGIGAVSKAANGWAGDIIRVNAEMQRLMVQMGSMAKSADPIKEAAENVRYLRNMAMNSPYALDNLAKSFVKLQSTGIDPMNGSLQSLVDGVAAFGGGAEALDRVTLAISQISGKGVLQMEELRQQLGESMPRAVELMARSMGVGMSELIKTIQTGRVQAGPALQALYDELDRTYGGRAKQMMQTFDGQLKQTTTLWQTLMTTIGGLDTTSGTFQKGGFFDTVTAQLKDLNDILSRPMTIGFARDIGAGLANVTKWIRDVIDGLIYFRREIAAVAVAAGVAFSFKAALAGLSQLRMGLLATTVEFRAMGAQFAQAQAWFAAAQGGFTSMNTVMTATQMGAIGLGAAIKGIGIGIMASLPWIAALGLAVYAAASYFDWFGNKTKDAYEDLVKFGAESKRQAQETVADRLKQIDDEIALEKRRADYLNLRYNLDPTLPNKTLERLYAERAKIVGDGEEAIAKAAQTENDRVLSEYTQMLDAKMAKSKTEYDTATVNQQKASDAELANMKNTGKAAADIERERAKKLYDIRVEYNQKNIDLIDGLLKKNREAQLTVTDPQIKEQLDAEYALLQGHNARFLEERQSLRTQKDSFGGIDLGNDVVDQQSLIESGTTKLKNLKDEVTKLAAEFAGANGEYAKMQAAIARGDYGSIAEGGEEVRELHEELLKATRQKEALDEIMKGRSAAEAEVERLRKKALEDQLTAQLKLEEAKSGRKFTEAEELQWKIKNGWFPGVGEQKQVETWVQKLIDKFGETDIVVQNVADALKQQAFGNDTYNAMEGIIGQAQRLVGILSAIPGMGPLVDQINGIAATPGIPMGTGKLAGTDYLSNLIGAESGGNNNAKNPNSSATGVGQFIESTWMRFLGEVHPEIVNSMTKQQALALRTNNDYMMQAIDWYTNQNAKALSAAGNTLTDANLYLAHFLGSGGANKVLGASNNTALASLLPQSTMTANPFLQGKDVAWIKQWSQNKFGTGLTANLDGYVGQVGGKPPVAGLNLPDLERVNQLTAEKNTLVEKGVQLQEQLVTKLDETKKVELDTQGLEAETKRIKLTNDLKHDLEAANLSTEKLGNAYKRVVDAIKAGELDYGTDIEDPRYKELLDLAKELDATNDSIAEKEKARTAITGEQVRLKEQEAKIQQEIADANARIKDPNFKGISSDLQNLQADLDQYVEHFRVAEGENSQAYQDAVAYRSSILQQQRLLEVTKEQEAMAQERTTIQTSLMNQTQQRQAAMQKQLAAVDAWVERARQAGMEEVEIVREAEAQKAAIRQQYAQTMNPMTKQMQEWGDLQGNLAQQSTQWMDSLAGGITDLIMGTGDLRSVIQGIMKDMINMLVKYAMSGMKGGKGGMPMMGGGKGMGMGGKGMKMMPIAHTGGILGSTPLKTRRAHAAVFSGAPKFHTGGIIGGLTPSEMPIIAQKGEGVFTKEQMANLQPAGAGGQVISINAPVTVNASGGTPGQNADLAKQMARQFEQSARTVVADELRKQARQGNMLNSRSR